jgi:hypothetical protein
MVSFDDLKDGTKVVVRLSKRDNAAGDAPLYGRPKIVQLSVHRRDKTVKHGGRVYPAGQIYSLSIGAFWAEYSEDDYDAESDEWLCEEYRMKILSVGVKK